MRGSAICGAGGSGKGGTGADSGDRSGRMVTETLASRSATRSCGADGTSVRRTTGDGGSRRSTGASASCAICISTSAPRAVWRAIRGSAAKVAATTKTDAEAR